MLPPSTYISTEKYFESKGALESLEWIKCFFYNGEIFIGEWKNINNEKEEIRTLIETIITECRCNVIFLTKRYKQSDFKIDGLNVSNIDDFNKFVKEDKPMWDYMIDKLWGNI